MGSRRQWFKRNRILILLYGVGLLAGVREYMVNRDKAPFEWMTPEGEVLIDVLDRLDPDAPDTKYLRAMRELANGNEAEFSRLLDDVLASGVKHNEAMLRFHASYLIGRGAGDSEINAALNRWRGNFPFAQEPIMLPLPTGPTTSVQAESLEAELARIPWMADVQLGFAGPQGAPQWRIQMMIRRGRPIDVRDVWNALSVALAR
jgi:hypothetical protein